MAKNKRRKSSRKKTVTRPAAPTLSKTDLLVIQRLGNINGFIPYLGMITAIYLLYDGIANDAKIVRAAGWTFYVCSFVAPVFMLIGLRLSNLAKEEREKPRINLARYRRLGIATITVSIFVNILGLIPLLYGKGYIARLANFLPGREQLGNKLSLAVAFVLGAIISGVLGNAAYDLLKFVIRKMIEGKS
jgi:uncharacterized membrane protein